MDVTVGYARRVALNPTYAARPDNTASAASLRASYRAVDFERPPFVRNRRPMFTVETSRFPAHELDSDTEVILHLALSSSTSATRPTCDRSFGPDPDLCLRAGRLNFDFAGIRALETRGQVHCHDDAHATHLKGAHRDALLYGVVGDRNGATPPAQSRIDHLVEQKQGQDRGFGARLHVHGSATSRRGRDPRAHPPLLGRRDGPRSVAVQTSFVHQRCSFQNAAAYIDDVPALQTEDVLSDFDSYAWFFARRFGLPSSPSTTSDHPQVQARGRDHERVGADFHATRAFVKSQAPVASTMSSPRSSRYHPGQVSRASHHRSPILREEILKARPTRGEHVSTKRHQRPRPARQLNRPARAKVLVYGLGRTRWKAIAPCTASPEQRFVRDLASARAVVTNGGLSLMHEASPR